ncbi:FmdE family protein [Desulfovibrio inopinatus]|uniref:FmdE family protein n=1 Tax=Desulfovibrio inopinatus TaxID=102109 RepID=UPI00041E5406|nr:FmdE family protein [Desulfovibrio inopinatus]
MTTPTIEACIGQYSADQYIDLITRFHSYPAPGLIVGGFMVELAKRHMPEGVLYDAVAETSSCLPDAIQLLTPCTAGNNWLKIVDLGRYAMTLFNKHTGEGVRVHLDQAKLGGYDEYRVWYFKEKHKKDQNSSKLRRQIFEAGESVLTVTPVRVLDRYVGKVSKGGIGVCPICNEAYPVRHGPVCLGCSGQAPTFSTEPSKASSLAAKIVPVEEAVGKTTVHDMTRIAPGTFKGVEFKRGHTISVGDVCRLQHMGRMHVYVADEEAAAGDAVHEDEAAGRFATSLCAEGSLVADGPVHEGKITLAAAHDGLLLVNDEALKAFNLCPDVALSVRRSASLVKKGDRVAGVRALPLFIDRPRFLAAHSVLKRGTVISVAPLRPAKVGILITGTEVFQGLIEDRFEPILTKKVQALGSQVIASRIVPDDKDAIKAALADFLGAGCDLIMTTAGLSVDPDDVTRQAIIEAGAQDIRFGVPLLPGNMALVAKIGAADLLGVPACALFYKTTSIDRLLPRILAGVSPTRQELASFANGGFCLNCETCSFPHCPFGG